MSQRPPLDNEHRFLKLTQWAGAFSLAVMFGFFGAIDGINPRIEFSINWKVWVGFLGGGAFCFWVIGKIFVLAEEADRDKTKASNRRPLFWTLVFCFIVVGLTLAGFVYSLKGTSESQVRDVIIGNVIAIWVVGFCCLLVWNLIQFFEENSAEAEKKFNEEHGISNDPKD